MRETSKKNCTSKTIIAFHIWVLLNSIILAQSYVNWTEVDSLNIARVGHAMVVLPNGDVLISGSGVDSVQSSCEIYEFGKGKWRYTTPMNVPRESHNLILLNTGKVLAIGGYKEQSCELFDPTTETWAMTDSIPTFRLSGQTVTELSDGRIIVIGGYYIDTTSLDFIILNKVDIYSPLTETWVEAATMNLERTEHTATLLNDGSILVAGGNTENFQTDECEIYDPVNNTWSNIMPMLKKRYGHAAILLTNGNAFISGGNPSSGYTCEVFDVNNNQWGPVSNMMGYRAAHKIYYLSIIDRLLIVGGDALPPSTEDTWEIYDPNSLISLYYKSFPINQFLFDNNIQLADGNIMVSGGEEYDLFPIPHTWPSKRCWIYDATTGVAQDTNASVENFFLSQNYPNPFNPTTTVKFSLREIESVSMKVYNILGKEIKTLLEKELSPGNYKVDWDGKDSNGKLLPTGVYLIRMCTENYNKAVKAILLK